MAVLPLISRFASTRTLPRAEIEECRRHWQDIGPVFLDVLCRAAGGGSDLEEEEWEALFWVIHMLGERGETGAFEPFVVLLKEASDLIEEEFGDAVTETVPGILIRTFNGKQALLEDLIEDRELDEFLRAGALEAWTYLAVSGRIDRDHAATYMRQCADFRLEPRDDCFVWDAWARCVAYLGLTELRDEVRQVFKDGRISPENMGLDDFERALKATFDAIDPAEVMERDALGPLTDIIAKFERWSFAHDDEPEPDLFSQNQPAVNPYRHVGRNDPCPCGSGKKFKKCCADFLAS